MSRPPIHATIEVASALQGDPQTFIPSHDVDFPGLGKVIIHHGSFAFVGQRDGDCGRGISLIVGGKCECGCGNPAQAFSANLSPDEARAFTADGELPALFGRRRFARELPRLAHRAHLVVGLVRLERLHDVTDADARAEGYPDRAAYRTAWDELHAPGTRTITGDATRWADNPAVTVIAFTFAAAPIAQLASPLKAAA
ncbi:hypothetical protein [Sphingomonas sp.]|uniref:hypothetical protein n=1 Tax=Sphingomonas sp. TaxID=28214 RepID=UPI003F730C7E